MFSEEPHDPEMPSPTQDDPQTSETRSGLAIAHDALMALMLLLCAPLIAGAALLAGNVYTYSMVALWLLSAVGLAFAPGWATRLGAWLVVGGSAGVVGVVLLFVNAMMFAK